jgi:hypothetical protein
MAALSLMTEGLSLTFRLLGSAWRAVWIARVFELLHKVINPRRTGMVGKSPLY